MAEGSTRPGLNRLIRLIVRILLVALIGAALGGAAYFGLPLAYRGLVEPVRHNAERIDGLQEELDQMRTDQAERSERSARRTAELEAENAALRESLAELRAEFEGGLTDQQRQLSRLESQLETLDERLDSQSEALDQALEASAEPDPELLGRLSVTRAMLHLLRARLWLIENNLGLAAEQVQVARSALSETEGFEPVIERLDQALAEMVTSPLVAADDLEIAWRMLTAEPAAEPVAEP